MTTTITTISVHAERAEALREYRDEHNLPSMDAALESLSINGAREAAEIDAIVLLARTIEV